MALDRLQCPACKAVMKMKTAVPAGTPVKCVKCKKPFKAAAVASAPKETPSDDGLAFDTNAGESAPQRAGAGKKSGASKVMILLGCAVLLVFGICAGGGVGGYFWFFHPTTPDTKIAKGKTKKDAEPKDPGKKDDAKDKEKKTVKDKTGEKKPPVPAPLVWKEYEYGYMGLAALFPSLPLQKPAQLTYSDNDIHIEVKVANQVNPKLDPEIAVAEEHAKKLAQGAAVTKKNVPFKDGQIVEMTFEGPVFGRQYQYKYWVLQPNQRIYHIIAGASRSEPTRLAEVEKFLSSIRFLAHDPTDFEVSYVRLLAPPPTERALAHRGPKISPDGRFVIFTTAQASFPFRLDLQKNNLEALGKDSFIGKGTSWGWSVNSKGQVWVYEDPMWLYTPEGGKPLLPKGTRYLAFASEHALAVTLDAGKLNVHHFETGAKVQLQSKLAASDKSTIVTSPDGALLAVSWPHPDYPTNFPTLTVHKTADGSIVHTIDDLSEPKFGFTADSKHLIFTHLDHFHVRSLAAGKDVFRYLATDTKDILKILPFKRESSFVCLRPGHYQGHDLQTGAVFFRAGTGLPSDELRLISHDGKFTLQRVQFTAQLHPIGASGELKIPFPKQQAVSNNVCQFVSDRQFIVGGEGYGYHLFEIAPKKAN